MKRLLQFFLLLATSAILLGGWCVPAHAAITVTNVCSNYLATSGTTVTCTATVAAGHTIEVSIAADGSSTQTVSSVVDAGGANTYVASPGSPCTETTTPRRLWVYYVKNNAAITSKLVTVTFGATNTAGRYLAVNDISGASTTAPLDKETCNKGEVSSVADPGSTTLTFNNEAIIEWAYGGGVTSVGTGYTQLAQPNGAHEVQDKVVTTGAWGASALGGGAIANWVAAAATFTDAVGGASPPPPQQMLTGVGD